jgi:hypothetical protein
MNKRNACFGLLLVGVAMIGIRLGPLGCEQAKNISNVDVEPSQITLAGSSNVVQFTASTSGALALPLTWSVSDPSLGGFSSTAGSNAFYVRSVKNGDNVIFVRDQFDVQGSAVVSQR